MRGAPKPLVEVLEKEWDAQLFRGGTRPGLVPMLGWTLTYHTLRSKGSRSGFPDRVLVRDRHLFVELKRELTVSRSENANRVAKPEQVRWLDALAGAGAEVYLWRPSDLEEIGRILTRRWVFQPYREASGDAADFAPAERLPTLSTGDRLTAWTPASAWIPRFGRADGAP